MATPDSGPSLLKGDMMRRSVFGLATMSLMIALSVTPAIGGNGTGELNASFQAGLSGGQAIVYHSDVAAGVASPKINPEGRLEPFGDEEFICDDLIVGTWVFVLDDDRSALDAWTNSFMLDGQPLDTVRTPNKRVSQGPEKGAWWFAEGVPVLGTLASGLHDIEWSFDDGAGPALTFNTPVEVDASHC